MAVQTVTDITESILNQLRLTDPSVSAEVGTPEREFIEAIAEIIASAQVDFSVLDSQHDIDTMTGSRLDSYLGLFGFQRQQGLAAGGVVTFSCNTTATSDIVIPVGTPVSATASDPTFPDVTFNTTLTVTLPTGGLEVDAPVQAALPGTIGNVAANSVTGFAGIKTIIGISGVRNDAAMSGGTDPESDDDFRIRFKNTIFRNMAGTNDQFLALAVSQPNVTKAVVVGPISRYQEYVLVPSVDDAAMNTASGDDKNYDPGGTNFTHKRTTAASTIPYSKYTYNAQYYVSDGTSFARPDVDYVFNRHPIDPANGSGGHRHFLVSGGSGPTGNPKTDCQPNITILGHSSSVFPVMLQPGTTVLLEHAYISNNSRNDINSGVMNAVDVFTNGSFSRSVKSAEVMPGSGNILQNSNANAWTYQLSPVINFRRFLTTDPASVGNKIVPLFWQPVLTVPAKVSIKHSNTTTYTLYGARFYSAGEYYYDDPNGTYTGAQVSAGYPRVANYIGVYESNGYQGTLRARSGLEIRAGKNVRKPVEDGTHESFDGTDTGFIGSQFVGSLAYTYDQNPGALQAIMEQNKQVTTDVLVHRAVDRFFHINITVMYTAGATPSVVDAGVLVAMTTYFENQYFGATIQLSDILQVVHNVPGVDNVRWTHDITVGTHKVEEVKANGDSLSPPVYFDTDFYLQDNQLADVPSANAITTTVRTQNTWGS